MQGLELSATRSMNSISSHVSFLYTHTAKKRPREKFGGAGAVKKPPKKKQKAEVL